LGKQFRVIIRSIRKFFDNNKKFGGEKSQEETLL
jgi:hypothetical protein